MSIPIFEYGQISVPTAHSAAISSARLSATPRNVSNTKIAATASAAVAGLNSSSSVTRQR